MSPDFFATLGVSLAMRRPFAEDEMADAQSNAAILPGAFWHHRFDADLRVLGRKFQVDGQTGHGVRLLLGGIGLGLVGAWAAGRAMQAVLFGVGAVNSGVWGARRRSGRGQGCRISM